MNTEQFTLRQLITERLIAIEKELKALRGEIEAMGERPIRGQEFENLKLQVTGLTEGLYELEQRVSRLEEHKSFAQWLFRQAVTIVAIVAVIYILEIWR